MSQPISLPAAAAVTIEDRMKSAAVAGNIDTLYQLIREDPQFLRQIDEKDFVETPMHVAANFGHERFCLEIMRLMPSFSRKPNLDGRTPLQLAMEQPDGQESKVKLVKRLVNVDPDLVRVKGREGMTLLHTAAKRSDADLLVTLLSACPASITDFTIGSQTALHIAVGAQCYDACNALIGWLRRGFYTDIIGLEEKVLNWRDDEGNTALHIAVSTNQPQIVELLVKNKIDMNGRDLDGNTARDIMESKSELHIGLMKKILAKGKSKTDPSPSEPISSLECLNRKISISENMILAFLVGFNYFSPDNRDRLLVVAVLIATATYQAGINPPGGLYDNDSGDYFSGTSKLPNFFYYFYEAFNTIAFLASLGLIIVLLPLGPWHLVLQYSLIACYMMSVIWLSPSYNGTVFFTCVLTIISLFITWLFFSIVWKRRFLKACRQIMASETSEKWQNRIELYEMRSNRFISSLLIMLLFWVMLLVLLYLAIQEYPNWASDIKH